MGPQIGKRTLMMEVWMTVTIQCRKMVCQRKSVFQMTTLKLTKRLRQRNSTSTCSHVSILTQTKKTRRTGRTQALEWTFQKLTMSEICIHLMTLSCLTTDVKRTKRSKGPNASAYVNDQL